MTTTEADNTELVHRFVDAINQQNWNAVREFLTADVVINDGAFAELMPSLNATRAFTPRFQTKGHDRGHRR